MRTDVRQIQQTSRMSEEYGRKLLALASSKRGTPEALKLREEASFALHVTAICLSTDNSMKKLNMLSEALSHTVGDNAQLQRAVIVSDIKIVLSTLSKDSHHIKTGAFTRAVERARKIVEEYEKGRCVAFRRT